MVKPEQAVEFDYPGYDGFKVTLNYLGREKLNTIRKECVVKKLGKGGVEESLNMEKFNRLYSEAVILGWSGLTLEVVGQLMLVTLPSEVDVKSELEFTNENAEQLLKHSTDFDTFVTSMLSDLGNFTKHG